MEEPGFGVESRSSVVVGDFDLAQLAEGVEGFDLGGAHVASGEDAEFAASFGEFGEGLLQDAKACPLEERAEQVDLVGGVEFAFNLVANPMLAPGVDQQVGGVEGDGGADGVDVGDGVAELDAEELEQLLVHGFVVVFQLFDEDFEQAVGERHALFRGFAFQDSEKNSA